MRKIRSSKVGSLRRFKDDVNEVSEFPNTFLFAGSHLRDNGPGPRQYLADLSGNVISISTFGDELLCLPTVHGHANDSLMWQIDAAELRWSEPAS